MMARQSENDDIFFVIISHLGADLMAVENWISRGSRLKKDDSSADRQMTDLIFPGHKSRKNAKSAKIKSAVRKTKKHDR